MVRVRVAMAQALEPTTAQAREMVPEPGQAMEPVMMPEREPGMAQAQVLVLVMEQQTAMEPARGQAD